MKPKLLILDEPTEGIQPSIIDRIEDAIYAIKKKGNMSVILVEQYLDFERNATDRFYILVRGSVVRKGESDQLDNDFIEINNQLYVISPDSGLVALPKQEIMLSPQIRTIRVDDIGQAKQTIDLINN